MHSFLANGFSLLARRYGLFEDGIGAPKLATEFSLSDSDQYMASPLKA